MLILPLPPKPDWSHPPRATLAIMLLCVLVFLMQGTDYRRSNDAWRFYTDSGLANIELPAYRADLAARGKAVPAVPAERLLHEMTGDTDFMERLRGDRVITPSNEVYPAWRDKRARYEKLEARIFTVNYALKGQQPTAVTMVSHMFLHADIMHLAGNMAVLFVVGYTVEAALGPLGFLLVYLLGGLISALPELFFQNEGYRLSLGASGAISAIMAAYVVLFGQRRIKFFYWFLFFFGTARWPALVILPVWLGNELLQDFVFDRGSNVNYMAHFFGLIGGALLVGLYRWRRQGQTAALVERQDVALAIEEGRRRAEALIGEMQFAQAARQYRQLFADYRGKAAGAAGDYLRIARLARQPELLADAVRCLFGSALRDPKAADPLLLAEAVAASPGGNLGLAAGQTEIVLARLIDGRQFDAAERIVLRLFSRPEVSPGALRQASRLVDACLDAGDEARAAPLRRLLVKHEKLGRG